LQASTGNLKSGFLRVVHAFDEGLPEGLRRERKGPLNPSTGRANKI
jgi:hypothetical protein